MKALCWHDKGDIRCDTVPDGMGDESVLFLTDILPTGWQGAEHCETKGGEIIAVWGPASTRGSATRRMAA